MKLYLCKICGLTDPTKFGKRGEKSCCVKCRGTKRRLKLGQTPRVIKEYNCNVCGTNDGTKFYKRKNLCNACKSKDERDVKYPNRILDYINNRREIDPTFRLITTLRARQRQVLKGITSTTKGLGCSKQELRLHIEKQWQPWMTWENYGNKKGQWSLDHKIPLSSFEKDANGAWKLDSSYNRELIHYSNLQPLDHWQNMKKRNKV